jgi:plasmid stability protein
MSVTVELPDELAERLRVLAAARGITMDQAAVEAITAQLPGPRRLSFAGIGDSGHDDIAERHREIITEAHAHPEAS